MAEIADKVELAEALFDNESEWPGELEFRKGEILRIVDKKLNSSTDGWWVCANNRGLRGIVPANRLKIVDKANLYSFENRHFSFFDHDLEFPPIDGAINVDIPRPSDFDDRFSSMNKNNNSYVGNGSQIRRMMDFSDDDQLLTDFKNFRLLHGIERPYKICNSEDISIGNVNENFYSIPKKTNVTVRNVPITIEKQNRAGQSSPLFSTLPPSTNKSRASNTLLAKTNDATTVRNGIYRPKAPPAPPTRRHVTYSADGVGKPALGPLKSRKNGFSDGASSSGYDVASDTYDVLPTRTSPTAATLSRPRKTVRDFQQQPPHRVRFAADYDANNAIHCHPQTADSFAERQIPSSDADDRSSSITLTSSSADSSFSNGSSTTANDALVQARSDNLLYDVPRHLSTASNRYDVGRIGKEDDLLLDDYTNQNSHSVVDNSLIASVYDAPLSTIRLSVPSTSVKPPLQKSQLSRKSPFDDYDFVDGIAKNGTKNGNKLTEFDGNPNNFYQEKLEILSFYVPQVDSQMESLNRAIDDFLSSVESNSPPRDFVAKSRFVVLSAHKLVYLGDSLSHCLKNLSSDERDKCSVDKLSSSCDRLCDALKSCVASTKRACSTFPCVEDVQTMVDSMVRISNDAHEFKLSVAQLARQ